MTIPLSIFPLEQAAVLMGIAALFGAIMGSFINCLAWRLVHGENVLHGRSHCATCNHELGALDLVPVFSWLFLRGRCRYCKQPVSLRYVVVEVLMAATFALLLSTWGIGVQALVYMALSCILMGAALVDLDTFTIPNGFIVAALVLWAATAWFMPAPPHGAFWVGSLSDVFAGAAGVHLPAAALAALDGAAGALGVGGGILLFSLAFDAATGKESLGGGDIKLLFALGLFFGLAASLLNLLLACIAGLVFALVRALSASRGAARDSAAAQPENARTAAIPFGPAIACAAVFTMVVGPALLSWYAGLF